MQLRRARGARASGPDDDQNGADSGGDGCGSLSLCFSGSLFLSGHFQDCKYCIPIAVRTTFVRITHDRDVYAAVIDEYYAACQDAIDTNGNGEVEEWNVVSAPQVKMLAEQCGCAAAGRAQAAVLWLATAAVVQHAVLH